MHPNFYLEGVTGFTMAAKVSEGGPPLFEGITRTLVFFFLDESEDVGDFNGRC